MLKKRIIGALAVVVFMLFFSFVANVNAYTKNGGQLHKYATSGIVEMTTPNIQVIVEAADTVVVQEKEVFDGYVCARTGEMFTRDEGILLAAIVWCEARGEGDTHQELVAKVVLNRVRNKRFPNTIHDVVYQKGQYECVTNGQLDKALWMYNHPEQCTEDEQLILEKCLENAAFILTSDYCTIEERWTDECKVCAELVELNYYDDVVYQAEFVQGSGVAFHLGNTYFCYEQEVIKLSELKKTSIELCKKCKYSKYFGNRGISNKKYCDYLNMTGKSRACPVGYCDKFEKK